MPVPLSVVSLGHGRVPAPPSPIKGRRYRISAKEHQLLRFLNAVAHSQPFSFPGSASHLTGKMPVPLSVIGIP